MAFCAAAGAGRRGARGGLVGGAARRRARSAPAVRRALRTHAARMHGAGDRADAAAAARLLRAPPPPAAAAVVCEGDEGEEGERAALVAREEGGERAPDVRLYVVGAVAAMVVLTVGGVWMSGGLTPDAFVALAQWFESLGPAAIVAYSAFYFVLELLAVPATPLTLGCGYLFGVVKGSMCVSVAATAAAAVSFLIARYALRDTISSIASRYPKFRALDRAIGREGFKFVLLLRLSPLLPFALSNYLYGLTSLSFRDYLLGSWLGMLPGTIAYVSAGAAVSAIADIGGHKGAVSPWLVGIGAVATVATVAFIGKLASTTIAESVEMEEDHV